MRWVDDFDGAAGSPPGPWWVPEHGHGRWGDPAQQQWYTCRTENVALDGEVRQRVTARREPVDVAGGGAFAGTVTSARLVTLGAMHLRYGLVEARIRVPGGGHLAGVLDAGYRHGRRWLAGVRRDRRHGTRG